MFHYMFHYMTHYREPHHITWSITWHIHVQLHDSLHTQLHTTTYPLHDMSELMITCCHPHHVSPPQVFHSKSHLQLLSQHSLAQLGPCSGMSSTPFWALLDALHGTWLGLPNAAPASSSTLGNTCCSTNRNVRWCTLIKEYDIMYVNRALAAGS